MGKFQENKTLPTAWYTFPSSPSQEQLLRRCLVLVTGERHELAGNSCQGIGVYQKNVIIGANDFSSLVTILVRSLFLQSLSNHPLCRQVSWVEKMEQVPKLRWLDPKPRSIFECLVVYFSGLFSFHFIAIFFVEWEGLAWVLCWETSVWQRCQLGRYSNQGLVDDDLTPNYFDCQW